jgi:hypothetical protein
MDVRALECGEDRRFPIFSSRRRRLGRKQNAKAAILAALQIGSQPADVAARIEQPFRVELLRR